MNMHVVPKPRWHPSERAIIVDLLREYPDMQVSTLVHAAELRPIAEERGYKAIEDFMYRVRAGWGGEDRKRPPASFAATDKQIARDKANPNLGTVMPQRGRGITLAGRTPNARIHITESRTYFEAYWREVNGRIKRADITLPHLEFLKLEDGAQ